MQRRHAIVAAPYRAEVAATPQSLMKEGVDAICYKPLDAADLFAKMQQLVDP